jgi:hypothetical protein
MVCRLRRASESRWPGSATVTVTVPPENGPGPGHEEGKGTWRFRNSGRSSESESAASEQFLGRGSITFAYQNTVTIVDSAQALIYLLLSESES